MIVVGQYLLLPVFPMWQAGQVDMDTHGWGQQVASSEKRSMTDLTGTSPGVQTPD